MYNPQYVEIPLTEEQAEKILQIQYTKEEADLLCFLAEAFKKAKVEAESVSVNLSALIEES